MITKEGLYYSEDHEWIEIDDNIAIIGITDFAQNALGEIVYVELPELEEEYELGDSFCVIESVKAASDAYIPLSGKVIEINEELEDDPQLLNEGPYENWIAKVQIDGSSGLDDLMNEEDYIAFCQEEENDA